MSDSIFVLDANVFIQAARLYYAFDLVPIFWVTLCHYAATGHIQSIDRVFDEIKRGKDQLAEWAKKEFSDAFCTTNDSQIISVYSDIMSWVNNQKQFMDAAKAEFAVDADGWLVAYAKVKGCVIVTDEKISVEAKARVPLPNVCQAFGIKHINTFEMLRKLEVKFK